LPLHAGTGTALLKIAGLIDHQHRARITQVLYHMGAHIVTDRPGVPPGTGEQVLHPIRRGIRARLR